MGQVLEDTGADKGHFASWSAAWLGRHSHYCEEWGRLPPGAPGCTAHRGLLRHLPGTLLSAVVRGDVLTLPAEHPKQKNNVTGRTLPHIAH
jgi:hypothetical protein